VDTKDISEGTGAESVDEDDVGVDAENVSEAPHAEVLAEASCYSRRRY
jgi:hypothetical protein